MVERAVVMHVPGLVWTAGAPMPVVLATEDRTLFAFYLAESEVIEGLGVQTAEFVGCSAVTFGFPNDEVLHGHRLWNRGLEFYGLHIIEDSTWLDELRRIERVHDRAPPNPFADSKHFLLTFHDSTLEAIADGVVPLSRYETMAEAVAALVKTAGRA
ncbi:MAG TPA: hypothetical protein VG795_00725 [Acidimicrobiia bacterium]|nr:hypothetical protein [Acidimicrobiia bacterium]